MDSGVSSVELTHIGQLPSVHTEEQSVKSLKRVEAKAVEWRKHLRTLTATLSAALGAVGLGTIFAYTAPAIPDINSRPNPFHLTEMEVAVVVSVASLGGLAGGPLGGVCLDKFGRKSTLLYAILPFVFGWLLIVAAPNMYCMCAGRLLTGVGAGVFDVSVPVYIAEISAPNVRGFMGSCHELSTNIGILYAFTFGSFLSWTWLAEMCLLIPIFMMFCMIMVPESPKWLFRVGRKDECAKSLRWFRGSEEAVNKEMNELAISRAQDHSKVGWGEFRKPNVYRPLFTIVGLMFFQQMAGYGVVPSYMVSILNAGGTKWDPNAETAVVGALGVVANLFSAVIVDRVGRRVMLLVSAAIMSLSLVGLSLYFTLLEFDSEMNVGKYSMIPFVCIIVYNMSVALGYGPIPFYLASELLPLRVRGKAGGLAISSVWLFTFIAGLSFPSAVEAIGFYGVFWMMTGFALLSTVYAFIVVPETKGLSLEQIEKEN